jgi:glycosyltransferase involved in cell wall biosynthesis
MFLEALAEANGRGTDFVYLHIGLEEQSKTERELAARLGVDRKVRFLGWIEDPTEYLYAADLYVMCSTREGFSIAALEAMGCGLPLLLTDVPGLRDLRGVASGILWAELTSTSLVDGIETASRLPEIERSSLGARMSSSVHQRFCPAVGVSTYATLYRRQALPKQAVEAPLAEKA